MVFIYEVWFEGEVVFFFYLRVGMREVEGLVNGQQYIAKELIYSFRRLCKYVI